MRKDMKHVIVDRPRTGGDGGKSIPPKGTKKRLYKEMQSEDGPVNYQSSARGRVYGWDCKQFNEHLAPLIRWLSKQVGRPWDDVWKEICDGLSADKMTTAHVRHHADDFVEKNCTIVDGELCDSRGAVLNKSGWRWHRFYVDPETGNLREFEKRRKYRYRHGRKKDWVDGKNDNFRYYCLDGLWYEVELKPLPDAGRHYLVWDYVLAAGRDTYKGSYLAECRDYYRRSVYAASKRQINSQEIRRLNLRECK